MRRAGPDFVVQALGWVDFHRPAVQWLGQEIGDTAATRENQDPSHPTRLHRGQGPGLPHYVILGASEESPPSPKP